MSADERTREEHTVILAALLRGVQECLRLGQTDGEEPEDLAAQWKERFSRCVDADLLHSLVQVKVGSRSFDTRTAVMLELLDCADRFASPEPGSQFGTESSQSGLMPIFDRIELLERYTPKPRRFRLAPLSNAHSSTEPPFFAEDDYQPTPSDFTKHIDDFRRRLDQLAERLDWSNFDCVYTHLLHLLNTLGWCLPSAFRGTDTDISVYDRTRIGAAIAACLYRYHSETKTLNIDEIQRSDQRRFFLLTGGISGIQDYIFDISTIGAGGVAKRLRARSFSVQLLSDAGSLRVLRSIGFPITNLIMAFGAKFFLLLPNLPNAIEKLTRLQQEFDRTALTEFHGELALTLAWTDIADVDLAAGRYGIALGRLRDLSQLRKAQRLAGALQRESQWLDEFVREEQFEGRGICVVCARFPATHHSSDEHLSDAVRDICAQCHRQKLLGQRLTRAHYVSFSEDRAGDVNCFGIGITAGRAPIPGAFLVMGLNNPDMMKATRLPATFRYLANHIQHDEKDGIPWSFSEIAARKKLSEGETPKGMLGVVKADVDYLGQVFQEGLRRDSVSESLDSASRLAALSRQIDWFFSGWIEWLLTERYPDSYSVYSGGDDLLIVCPRAATLPIVHDIHDAFTRYTQNSQISISAGIAVVKPRLPLAHTVEQADGALRRAKSAKRNRLSILNQVINWHDLDLITESVALLRDAKPRSAFLYQLLQFGEMWQIWKTTQSAMALRFQPLLAYTISRNIEPRTPLFDWASRLVGFQLNDPETREAKLMDYIGLISKWVLLERREQDGNRE